MRSHTINKMVKKLRYLGLYFFTMALFAAERVSDVRTLFDIGKQALVLGSEPLLKEVFQFNTAHRAEKRVFGNSVVPLTGRDFEQKTAVNVHFQYIYLSPYQYSTVIQDRISLHNFNGKVEVSDWAWAPKKMVVADVSAEFVMINIASKDEKGYAFEEHQQKFIAGIIGGMGNKHNILGETGVSYGQKVQGRGSLSLAFFKAFAWQSNVFFDVTEYQDPSKRYIDNRGSLGFTEAKQSSGERRINLFDQFKLYDFGLSMELLHGQQPWKLDEAKYGAIKERIEFSSFNTFLELGYKGFEKFERRYVEPGIGLFGARNGNLAVTTQLTARFDDRSGNFHATRLMALINNPGFDPVPIWRVEATYRYRNHKGGKEPLFGYAIGFGKDSGPMHYEIAWYRNYIDHIDLVEGMIDVNFFKFQFTYRSSVEPWVY